MCSRRSGGQVADIYAARSGKSPEFWLGAMEKETYFTADQAESVGLLDSVVIGGRSAASGTGTSPRWVASAGAFRGSTARVRAAALRRKLAAL